MARSRNDLADYLYRIAFSAPLANVTDAELLDRFQASRDEASFAELVRRYGPVVYGVCTRVLNHSADAEDAFQATFIILVRRVTAIDRQRPLAGWLHTVAYQTALKARLRQRQLLLLERQMPLMTSTEQPDEIDRRELSAVLDEELQHLPAIERDLLILCDMRGQTQTEAAAALNRPLGSVSRLLGNARERLRSRLVRRGIGVSVGLLTTILAQSGLAAVPTQLNRDTIWVALLHAAETSQTAVASASASELAYDVMRGSLLSRVKLFAVGLIAASLAVTGILALHALLPATPSLPAITAISPASPDSPIIADRVIDPQAAPAPKLSTRVFKHDGSVTALAASSDGRHVASAGEDRVVRVWDSKSGRLLDRFDAPPEGVTALAFTPDGSALVAELPNAGLAVWDLATGRCRNILVGQMAGVAALSFSSDGQRLVSIGRNGKLLSLDLTRPTDRQQIADEEQAKFWARALGVATEDSHDEQPGATYAVAFTADGRSIYAVDRKLSIMRLDLRTRRFQKLDLVAPDRDVVLPLTTVAFSPNGQWLAWGNGDNKIGLADFAQRGPILLLQGHRTPAVALAFTPDGRTLASVDKAGQVIRWTMPDRSTQFQARKSSSQFRATTLAFSPDGKRLYGGGVSGEVRCWDSVTLEPIQPTPKK